MGSHLDGLHCAQVDGTDPLAVAAVEPRFERLDVFVRALAAPVGGRVGVLATTLCSCFALMTLGDRRGS